MALDVTVDISASVPCLVYVQQTSVRPSTACIHQEQQKENNFDSYNAQANSETRSQDLLLSRRS